MTARWKRWQCWFRGHDYIVERVQVAPTSDPNMADFGERFLELGRDLFGGRPTIKVCCRCRYNNRSDPDFLSFEDVGPDTVDPRAPKGK